MTEETIVGVAAAVLDPEPNPKRLMGPKEPFELFDEVLSLTTGSDLDDGEGTDLKGQGLTVLISSTNRKDALQLGTVPWL